MKTSRPVWGGENEDVETAAVVWVEGAEYRFPDGQQGSPKGSRAAGAKTPRIGGAEAVSGHEGMRAAGSDPMGMKNNPDTEKDRRG